MTSTLPHLPPHAPQPRAMGERVAAVDVPEDDLRRGVIYTRVSPAVAWAMTLSFLLLVFGVPLVQAAVEVWRGRRPQALDLFMRRRFPGRHDLRTYEEALREQSVVRQIIQPRVQERLTAWLGFGNTNVVMGRDGWLFYKPGVDYVTGRPFLHAAQLDARRRAMTEWSSGSDFEPDPRRAVLHFKRQCEEAGARLLVMPVPDKAMLQPRQLTRAAPGRAVPAPNNPSYAPFVSEMRAAGVDVFDPTPPVLHWESRYLEHDTHWTPQEMEDAAQRLATRLRPSLPAAPRVTMVRQPLEVSRVGDLVDMLRLPEGQDLFRPQPVTVTRVLGPGGAPTPSAGEAEVLLLGDSFSNIYSDGSMGWGDSGGFGEHLALHLGRPVDRLVRNDEGAWATRQMLADELARGRDRLAGRKVVVWQFAARELAVGNWKPIELRRGSAAPAATAPVSASGGFLSLKRGERLRVTGVVKVIGAAPRPGTVPYKDHVVAAHLTDVRDEQGRSRGEAVVYLWSLRDNKAAPAASYRPGQTVTLRVRPWAEVSRQFGSINRRELADPALLTVDPLWAEEETP